MLKCKVEVHLATSAGHRFKCRKKASVCTPSLVPGVPSSLIPRDMVDSFTPSYSWGEKDVVIATRLTHEHSTTTWPRNWIFGSGVRGNLLS